MKIFIVCKPDPVNASANIHRPETVSWFCDLWDAISDLIFSKVDLLIIASTISYDQDQIRDLVSYINKDVRVIFAPPPLKVLA